MSGANNGMVVVGVGNTSVQIGYVPKTDDSLPTPTSHLTFPSRTEDWSCLRPAIPTNASAKTPWFVASVYRDSVDRIAKWVDRMFPACRFQILDYRNFPITLNVDQPPKVGTDRIAAAVAVNRLRKPNLPAICIDAGTALTVNAIDRTGDFLGGAILPGTTTAGRALSKSTDQLPEIQISSDMLPRAIGKDTDQAIESGLFWGAVGAVKELIARFREHSELQDAEVFVTGGFGPALAAHIDPPVRPVPHLVLSGIAIAAESAAKN